MRIASGRYTGNGTTQNVTAPGWQADFVLVKLLGAQKAALWIRGMSAASFRPATGAVALTTSNGIDAHASGFTVGSAAELNTNASTYDWIAINDNSALDCHIGSYTGNASTNTITGMGLTAAPDFLLILGGGSRAAWFTTTTIAAGSGQSFAGSVASGAITSTNSDGFVLPNSSLTNANTETFYYVAIVNTLLTFRAWTYTGLVGAGNQTPAGFTPNSTVPENIITKIATTSTTAGFYGKNYSGDQGTGLDASGTGTGRIDGFVADGFHASGTSSVVNTNGATYHALAFKDGTTSPAAVTKPPSLGSLLGVQR